MDKDVYRVFVNIAFAAYYSKNTFRKTMKLRPLSKVITVPEEAFGLLTLENNYNRWKRIADLGEKASREQNGSLPDLLYQKNVIQQNGKKPSAGNWTSQGYDRMNALVNLVEERRKTRERFEVELKNMFNQNIDQDELESGWINTHGVKKRKRNSDDKVSSVVNCMRFRNEKI